MSTTVKISSMEINSMTVLQQERETRRWPEWPEAGEHRGMDRWGCGRVEAQMFQTALNATLTNEER